MDKDLLYFAPIAIYLITLFVQLRIFARTEELLALKSELFQYMSEHYLSVAHYNENHKALQEQISDMSHEVSDVKNLLITFVSQQNK